MCIALLLMYENANARTFLYAVEGWVRHEETGKAIENAVVVMINLEKKSTVKVLTDNEGYFYTLLEPEQIYDVSVSHSQFFTQVNVEINTTVRNKIFSHFFKLKEVLIGKGVRIEGIEFDPNTNSPTLQSEITLEKLHKLMAENPHLVFEIGVHTDSRGNDEYNLALSQGRADEIVFNLLKKGILKKKLLAKGYGETLLVNHCANGVRCNGNEHQLNRRIEFIVRDILPVEK